jgi:hypothetical protein
MWGGTIPTPPTARAELGVISIIADKMIQLLYE